MIGFSANNSVASWWGLVVLLALLVLLELTLLLFVDSYDEGSRPGTEARKLIEGYNQLADIGLRPMDTYSAIVQRPLFETTRRPSISGAASAQKQPSSNAAQLDNYTLTAIIITDEQRLAIFRDSRTKSTRRLTEGDALNDWRVDSIIDNIVIMKKDGLTHEMILHFRAGGKTNGSRRNTSERINRAVGSGTVVQTQLPRRPPRDLASEPVPGITSGPDPADQRLPNRPMRQQEQ